VPTRETTQKPKPARPNAPKPDVRDLARTLYLNTSFTLKQVAETVGVSQQTIGKWSAEEEWGELRQRRKVSVEQLDGGLLGELAHYHQMAIRNPLTYSQVLARDTIVRTRKGLLGETTLASKAQAIDQFLRVVQARRPDLAPEVAKLAQAYLHDLSTTYDFDASE